jgi:hypothetical protein|tara:strand:+ start:115 stop:366 length:252 start_codon:yes stop_codon:yes gene_type:complete
MLKEIAKLQTENRNYQKQQKKQDSLLRQRDEEITELRKKLDKYEKKEKEVAKNQSYIHAKALKEIDQKNQNERKHDTKDGRKK